MTAAETKSPHLWASRLPRIGIRPAIDGRMGGVRESLEDQTMNQAKSVAEFFSKNLSYPNGEPVECVIADTCIGGVAEAGAAAEKFARENVGVSLTVTPCWCYGSETMDMEPHCPKAVWGFNGTERPGAVYLAAVLSGHNQKGLPAFSIYGRDVQDADDSVVPDERHREHRGDEPLLVDPPDPEEPRVRRDVRDDLRLPRGGDVTGHPLAVGHLRPPDLILVKAIGGGEGEDRLVPVEQVERGDVGMERVPGLVHDGLEQLIPGVCRRGQAHHVVEEAQLFQLGVHRMVGGPGDRLGHGAHDTWHPGSSR